MAKNAYAPSTDGSRRIDLDKLDAGDTGRVHKEAGVGELEVWGNELAELGNLLTYAGKHALLVVLQGRDASGKDGTIRKILDFTNIQNSAVTPFKVPTAEEYSHDFLWRAHRVAPARGHVALFNRSYYEDVIAARVHNIVPEATWKRRYAHINAFEQLLVDNDVILLKFYLHVSRDEEIERLYAREKDPRTAWKLNPNDWRELPLWNEMTAAYEDALEKCATPAAPWYLVPADKKWYRNLAVIQRIVLELRPYKAQWLDALREMGKEALKDIRALRAKIDGKDTGKRAKRRKKRRG
jgi:PPK2 family polyphosphate:nucleotide phosphotransferase